METDYQRTQYIPDEGVVGNSAKLREYDDQSSDEEEEIERTTKQQSAGSKLPSSMVKHTISFFALIKILIFTSQPKEMKPQQHQQHLFSLAMERLCS